MDAAFATAPIVAPMSAAKSSPPQLDGGRVRDIVLVRIATGGKTVARVDLAQELWPIVAHLLPLAEWRVTLDRDLGALADAGLCEAKPVAVSVTGAGSKRAALVLGANALPRTWAEAKAGRLVAKALGLEGLQPRRLKALLRAEGLRAAIVQQAFKLKIRGLPTPARLRAQLATVALSRAFGNSLPPGFNGRSGLSAKAGRGLAGRLTTPPKEFPTDSRLISALAMEHAGASKADFENLQTALLRRYVTRGAVAMAPAPAKLARRAKVASSRTRTNGATAPLSMAAAHSTMPPACRLAPTQSAVTSAIDPAVTARPDFLGFVAAVRKLAFALAEGWPGNRKAFVSKVWRAVHERHAEWGLSEIEFKGMLAEAHRAGQLVLANADLKDNRLIADIQASAIAYKNAIFHYVRVDD